MKSMNLIAAFTVTGLVFTGCETTRSPGPAPAPQPAPSGFDDVMYRAAEGGHRHIIQRRLDAGANINTVNPANGWTPLHAAAYGGHKDLVSFMLLHGAAVNAVDLHGNTALHLAVGRGHRETVRSLISGGPDVSIRNKAGKTAADLASAETLTKFPQLKP
ncbi:protein phosphatase 1 regulatory subunit 27 [Phycisphaerales bacterium]|nr:protein phosphatase 1 regulatory subunit 27 [Phycisphaerales bacterium]